MIFEQPPQNTKTMTATLEAQRNETLNQKPDVFGETLDRLEHEADEIRSNPTLHAFLESVAETRGIDLPDLTDPELDEDTYLKACHSVLEMRKGKSRDEAEQVGYSEESLALLDELKAHYNMADDYMPLESDFDMGIALGGAADSAWRRLKPLKERIDAGEMNTDIVALFASDRPVNDAERERAKMSGFSKSGKPAMTEFDLSLNAASDQYDIDENEWEIIDGYDPSIPEQYHFQHKYKIAYAEKDGKHLFVLSAPMIGENRLYSDGNRRVRSNTADTFAMAARMLQGLGHTPRLVASTDSIFQFQRPDGESQLAGLGVEYRQMGSSRATVDMPEWQPQQYAQELWSLINQTYKGRNYLRAQHDIAA